MRRSLAALFAILGIVSALPAAAEAAWNANAGTGSANAKARSLASGNTPMTTTTGRSVAVSWSATGGPVPVDGYIVRRYDTSNNLQPIGSGCSGTVAGTSCTENAVPAGTWRYTVTPARQNWRGGESAQSANVTIAAPAMTLSPATVTSLPANLTGQITSFIAGETVTFRLDDPVSGTILSGSITPSPVPASGTAAVSVTLPAGTSNGSHTVYAVGNEGDTASASVTVNIPTPVSISTAVWSVKPTVSGTQSDQSYPFAFAGDGRIASATFGSLFSSSRYVRFDLNAPLPTGGSVSGASFNFNFASTALTGQACFWFEVRRASTNALLGTHGSAGSPVACRLGTTLLATSTAIPEVTSAAIANDLRIQVYGQNLVTGSMVADLATVSGTSQVTAFTLYTQVTGDASAGGTVTNLPWGWALNDGANYQSIATWPGSFSNSRFTTLTFPSYVPSGATINSVQLRHAYRPTSGQVCIYYEVYAGAALLGTHGSSGAAHSCNATATNQLDTIALPEVTSATQVNGLSVRLYLRSVGGATSSLHDLAALDITYTP